MPPNLIDIVKNRINRLFVNEADKIILQILSLLRIEIDISVLKMITEKSFSINVNQTLMQLERFEIIQSEKKGKSIFYSYCSSLIKDLVQNTVSNKTHLSGLIAGSLERISQNEGIDYYEEIAYHYSQAGLAEKASCYYEMAGDYAQRTYFNEKAIKLFDLAINLINDDIKIVSLSLKKAKSLEITGKWDDAITLLRKIEGIAQQFPDKSSLSKTFNLLAYLFLNKGSPESAEKYLIKSLNLSKMHADNSVYRETISYSGNYYYNQSEFDKALEFHTMHKDLCLKHGDKKGYSISLNNIGKVHYRRSDWTRALYCYTECEKISGEIMDKRSRADSYCNMGNVYYNLREHEKALEYYNKDKALSEEIGDKKGIAAASGNIGVIYTDLNRFDDAIATYGLYKKISEEIGDKKGIGIATGNMGNIYYCQNKLDKALECFESHKHISLQINDKQGIKDASVNIGNIYFFQGFLDKALICYNDAKEIADTLGDKISSALVLNNIGSIFMKKGNYSKALASFSSCRDLSRLTGDRRVHAVSLMNIGTLYIETGNFKDALDHIEKARDIFEKLNDSIGLANVSGAMAKVSEYTNCPEKALLQYDKAIDTLKNAGVIDSFYLECLLNKAELLFNCGHRQIAQDINKEAFLLANKTRDNEKIFCSKLQRYVFDASSNAGEARRSLLDMLNDQTDPDFTANIYYELYRLDGKREYRDKAIALYQALIEKTPKYEYKKRIGLIKPKP